MGFLLRFPFLLKPPFSTQQRMSKPDWCAGGVHFLQLFSFLLHLSLAATATMKRILPPWPLSAQKRVLQPDWTAVPADVLEAIAKRLLCWHDHAYFRSVCTCWRSASSKRPHVPSLLINTPSDTFELCDLPNEEFYPTPKLPEEITRGKNICGCSRGWIALHDRPRTVISLCNPFTGINIDLPGLSDRLGPRKVILSSDPVIHPHNCIIMVLCFSLKMFYCRPGDALWTPIIPAATQVTVQDIIFYKGKIYTVSNADQVFVCETRLKDPMFVEIMRATPLFHNRQTMQWHLPSDPIHPDLVSDDEGDGCYDVYFDLKGPLHPEVTALSHLIVSSGDLLMAVITKIRGKLSDCEVFRVDLSGGKVRLFRLENLGGKALFLGEKSMSFSLIVDNSSPHWCKGNCIYDAESTGWLVVFNMEDRSISYMTGVSWPYKYWFTPTLC